MIRFLAGENLNMGFDAVWSHRFRSALTVLGIVIGITTVVTVGSLTTGVREGIATLFLEFGPDNIFLNRFSRDPGSPGSPKELKRKPLRPEYAQIIRRSVRAVEDSAVQLWVTSETSGLITARVPGFETDQVLLTGFSANSFSIQPRELKAGRFFTPDEDERGARVCVLGPQVAEALFPDGRAVDRVINVAGADYVVVGVFAEAKGGFFGVNRQDQQIAVPLRTAMQRFPTEDRFIIVSKARPGMKDEAYEEIRQLMRRIRRTPVDAEDDFGISTPDQIVKRFDAIFGVAIVVSVALASLGLLVGGIGIMNIMLVSVTERTKEIGTRKAIGARKSDIIVQFLTEAVTLSGLGGVIGIVFAVLVTMLIGALVPALPSKVPAWAILLGFGVSVSVGLFFGTWPAVKAAGLDPVEALRHE
jgi:putative ABC transport system permease protein